MKLQKETGEGAEGSAGKPPVGIDPAQFAALQESVAKLESKNQELIREKSEAKKSAEKAAQDAAKKSGDVEALEKSWQEKLASEVSSRDKQISDYQSMVKGLTVGSEASRIAAELALPGSADVLLPHISGRMTVEVKDGVASIRVLDKNGKPSALSVDDLKNEITANAAFAPLLVGSKASGSGPIGGKGGSASVQVVKRAALDQMSPAQQMAVGLKSKKGEARIED